MRGRSIFIGILALASSAIACYNDVDTNLTELRDNLDVTLAVAGRFTIYPTEYYKRRIEIQSAILKKDPSNLDAYDNIAVAYDRIGDSANAMKWIHEKRKHLHANTDSHQLYSTEANEGTILIVRWIRGHKPGDVTDAIASEKCIANALKINPNAHFGREFAQLYSIRALIECGTKPDWAQQFSSTLISIADKNHIDRKKLRFGIAGMMVLGAAWEMPPMIQAIAALVPAEQQIVALCEERFKILDWKGSGFTAEDFPLPSHKKVNILERIVVENVIVNAMNFQENRQDWVHAQIAKGKHPDTNPDFWNGFVDVPEIGEKELIVKRKLPWYEKPGAIQSAIMQGLVLFGAFGSITCAIGYYIYRKRRFVKRGF